MTTVNNSLNNNKRRRPIDYILNIVIVIFAIIVIFEVSFSMNHKGVYIVHSSMYPTLTGAEDSLSSGGDYVYANTSVSPDYGDIVVIEDSRYTDITLIKRAIAFEGDTIKIEFGTVHIMYSGTTEYVVLKEPYVAPENNLKRRSYDEVIIQEGEIYLLGDNRDVSDDSRQHGAYWTKDIVGVVTSWSLTVKPLTTMIYNLFNF